jgi:hypothetical protein
MPLRSNMLVGPVVRRLSRLRFPVLFCVTLGLFLVDLIAPDPFPFADEILLGLAAAVLSQWRRRRTDRDGEGEADPSGSRNG